MRQHPISAESQLSVLCAQALRCIEAEGAGGKRANTARSPWRLEMMLGVQGQNPNLRE
jgi:hypothetical protein